MPKKKKRTKQPTIEFPLKSNRAPGRVLGLDISSQCVGWALFKDGALESYGKFNPRGRNTYHGEKLESFRDWLLGVLTNVDPKDLVIEAAYQGPRSRAFPTLQLYQAVVLGVYFQHYRCEMPDANRVYPKSIKTTLGIPTIRQYESRKKYMVNWVNRVYKLDLRYKRSDRTARVSDADSADAIAVVHAWLLHGKDN